MNQRTGVPDSLQPASTPTAQEHTDALHEGYQGCFACYSGKHEMCDGTYTGVDWRRRPCPCGECVLRDLRHIRGGL